jgi:hypothetical protein
MKFNVLGIYGKCHKFGHWADGCPKLAQKQLENSKMLENPSQSDDFDEAGKTPEVSKFNYIISYS